MARRRICCLGSLSCLRIDALLPLRYSFWDGASGPGNRADFEAKDEDIRKTRFPGISQAIYMELALVCNSGCLRNLLRFMAIAALGATGNWLHRIQYACIYHRCHRNNVS